MKEIEEEKEEKEDTLIDVENHDENDNIQKNEVLIEEDSNSDEEDEEKFESSHDKEKEEQVNLISEEEKKEKKDLLKIFRRLEEDLESDKFETLNQIFGQYINNEDITKRNIKPDTSRCSLIFMFYVISPLFGIVNLLGIFESITMMNTIFQILKNSVTIYINSCLKDYEPKTFSINEFNSKYNFYHLFFEDTKKESFDFNLMMFTAFLGEILLRSRGFRISTFVFGVINGLSIFLILGFSFFNYNAEDNTYTLFQILYLLLCWLLLLVGVGASALLSQQIIVDSNSKYKKYFEDLNEETKKKFKKKKKQRDRIKDNEEQQELTFIKEKQTEDEEKKRDKDILDDLFSDEEESKESEIKETKTEKEKQININQKKGDKESDTFKKMIENIQEVETKTKKLRKAKTLYIGEQKEEKEKNKKIKSKKIKTKNNVKNDDKNFDSFFTICLTTIIGYFLKYFFNLIIAEGNDNKKNEYMHFVGCANDTSCYDRFMNDNDFSINNNTLNDNLKKKIYEDENNSFYIIIIIYASCIIISIILYSIFVFIFTKNEKKENTDGNKYRVCEICGYTIYSEDIILNKNPPCCESCKLLCNTTKDCLYMAGFSLNKVIDFCNLSRRFCKGCFKKYKHDYTEDEKNKEYCCFCCCECSDYKREEYKKNKEFFCYCYQAKRKQTWFNKFLTSDIQKTILPYMVEYFVLQLLFIAFEKQYFSFSAKNESVPPSNNNTNPNNSLNFLENYFFSYNSNETNNDTETNDNKSNFIRIDDLYTFLVFVLTFFLFFILHLPLIPLFILMMT